MQSSDPYSLLIGNYDTEQSLSVHLLRNMAFLLKDYIFSRKRGESIEFSIKEALAYLEYFKWEKAEYLSDYQPPSHNKEWRDIFTENLVPITL